MTSILGRNTYRISMAVSLGLLVLFLARFIHNEYQDEWEFLDIAAKEKAYAGVIDEIEKRLGSLPPDSIDTPYLHNEYARLDSIMMSQELDHLEFGFRRDSGDAHIHSVIVLDADGQSRNILEVKKVSHVEILRCILPQIIFSLILLGSVLLTFWMIQRNLRRERLHADMRNNLMSNMSHELKTPVTTIGVALEALQSFDAANDASKRKEYLEITKQEVKRLDLLIDKTMNISLFESGNFTLERQSVDLRHEVETIASTMELQFQNHGAQVTKVFKGDQFVVVGDKIHLTNVVYNLLENTLKYAKSNPKISIHLEERKEELCLIIADNGIGIPLQYRKRIFEKLFRIPTGDEHNVKGHGLGLSYVKEVIQSHKGSIRATDSPLGGAAFEIVLPKNHTI